MASEEKKAVLEVEGRSLWDLTIGLRRIMASGLWRMERQSALEMCVGKGVVVRVSVEVFKTVVVRMAFVR